MRAQSRNSLMLSLTLLAASAYPIAGHSAEAFSSQSPWMTGDWGGTRSQLSEKGIDFQLGYTMESAANLAGGYRSSTTARYSDQWLFGVDMNLEKLLNWQDTEFRMTITNRDGKNIADQVADPRSGMLSSPQEVWGRGQTWRLTQFWLRKGWFDHRLDIKAGRMTVGEDFDSSNSQFQNLALGSGQAGNWRGDHWFNWPVSQWGGRVKLGLTPDVYLQAGFYNQNPYNAERGDGFRFEFSPTTGNLIPVELVWTPTLGPDQLPGNYRIGYYYSSANDNVYGSWRHQRFEQTAHAYGGYLVAQQQLTTWHGSANRGLTLTAQAVMNDHKTSKTDNYQSLALTWKGPFDARPQDEIGVGVARIHVNSSYTRWLQQQNLENGVSRYNSPTYLPVQSGTEVNYELYYNVQVAPWLQVRPDLQYVTAPGAVSQVKNAFIGGLSANITF